MPRRSEVMDAMIRAALRAAEGLRADLARPDAILVREKAASDFVSSADLRSQATIRAELGAAYPSYGLLLEEGDDRASVSGARFVVDPLDGTTNFLHGIPHFAVSIALEQDGEVVAGVVVDAAKDEVFWAEKGGGAWLGERRLKASSEVALTRAVVATGVPHHGKPRQAEYLRALGAVMKDVGGVRRMGAAALDLAYVAAGRVESFFETGLQAWDVAAGSLLVHEAGGVVTQTDGKVVPLSGDVLASGSEAMQRAMLERLASLHP